MDKDTLLKLEDVSSIVGSPDLAICKAINEMHAKIFGETPPHAKITRLDEDYIGGILDRIEEKITEMLTSFISSGGIKSQTQRREEPKLPEPVVVEERPEPEPDLDDIIESIAVVEFDKEVLERKNQEEERKDDRR